MKRISTNLPNNDMQYYMRGREHGMNTVSNKMAAQTRILGLRDDPAAAAHSTRYASLITRLERFSQNVSYAHDNHRITEGRVTEAVEVLQRVRELAVQGSNSTYTKDDLAIMGQEVNQLLNQLVEISNSRNGDGTMIFSGDKSKSLAFRPVEGSVAGSGEKVITNVEYIGSVGVNRTEISDGAYARINFPGSEVFWAENQQIFPTVDASAYQVNADTAIFIDGVEIPLKEGDTIHAIIAKINDSTAPVKAKLDPMQNSLLLQTTTPHQAWLRDGEGGRVFQDLGILRDAETPPPGNLNYTARVFGGSVFDMVIKLRDDMYQGKSFEIGGRGIRGIDDALESMTSTLGSIGAQGTRLEITYARLATETNNVTSLNSSTIDLDMTKAITDYRMLELTHKAALGVAGRILQPTLLDFLR
ncbi:MAG: flagellar hook-associated protein 3 [Spirochaetales bacterium]|jgi:flagellar hook-associated protein 3 FlgL|nr:flagellar hook-associated protein 3 [Spirochaetales bacterium]